MGLLERLTEDLARDALDLAEQTGNEGIVDDVSKALGDTSTTMQEAYLTAIRYFRAEARGRAVVNAISGGAPAAKPSAPSEAAPAEAESEVPETIQLPPPSQA